METFVVSAVVGAVMAVAGFFVGRFYRRPRPADANPARGEVEPQSPFHKAFALALQNGFILSQYGAYHYQLVRIEGPKWIYNFYPSTGKIVIDPHYRGPRIHLKPGWTLGDAVRAVIAAKDQP